MLDSRLKLTSLIITLLFIMSCNRNKFNHYTFSVTKSTNCQLIEVGNLLNDNTLTSNLKPSINTNLRSIDYKDKKVKFRIALSDENKNGFFNDSLIDKVFILDYGRDTIPLCNTLSVSSALFKSQIIISCDDEYYAISNISPQGTSIQIKRSKDEPSITSDINTYSRVSDLEFELLFGGKSNIKSITGKNKLIYIEFWGTWCKGCIQIIPDLQILHEKYHNEIQILSLNTKDDLDEARKFVQEKQLDWMQGVANKDIINKLLVASYPFGILLNSNGELIERGIKPKKVIQKYLKK